MEKIRKSFLKREKHLPNFITLHQQNQIFKWEKGNIFYIVVNSIINHIHLNGC